MKRKSSPLYIAIGVLLIFVGIALLVDRFGTRSGVTNQQVYETLPGDAVFPDPWISIDRAATYPVSAEQAWPWVAQLGANRGGWYAPEWLENTVHEHSATTTLPQFQNLTVGEVVPDFGGGSLKVIAVVPGQYVVYGSLRGLAPDATTSPSTDYAFTWALVLEDSTASSTTFHLRLRLKAPVSAGRFTVAQFIPPQLPGLIDYATDVVMFAGLREKLAKNY